MKLSQDLPDVDSVPCSPYIRIVPNGFATDEKGKPVLNDQGQVTLKASLIFTPTGDDTGEMDFSRWPAAMAAKLREGDSELVNLFECRIFRLQHGAALDCTDPTTDLVPISDIRISSTDFLDKYTSDKVSRDLTSIWRKSIAPEGSSQEWVTLLKQITATLAGERVIPGDIKDATETRPPKPDGKFGQHTNPPPRSGRQCDAILSTGRTDAALALEMQRARELIDSIGSSGEKTGPLPETKPPVEHYDKKFDKNFDNLEEDVRKKLVKEALKERKRDRHSKLWSALDKKRAQSKKNFQDASDALRDGKPAEICGYEALTPEDASIKTDNFTVARQLTEYAQWPQYADPSQPDDYSLNNNMKDDRLGQTYFSIEGNPGLARAFGLVFDIEIDVNPTELKDIRFALVNVKFREHKPSKWPQPWVLTKLARYGANTLNHGWPATSSEYVLWCNSEIESNPRLPSHCVPQFDGVINMGGVPKKGKLVPRYDITTLDIGAALDAEQNWLEAIEEKRRDDEAGRKDENVGKALRDMLSVGPDYQSNGLTLLCRSAAADAARKLAAINEKLSEKRGGGCIEFCTEGKYVIHDAEDLTNGFRLMVGVPGKDISAKTDWQSLMGRFYTYGGSGQGGNTIESLLKLAIGEPGSPERIDIESALQAVPARDIGTGGKRVETVVDETVGFWDGTPGGVPCGQVPDETEEPHDVMCFGRHVDIPTRGDVSKPPPMRNGRPYRFAMQAVFAGGRGIDIEKIPQETKGNLKDVRARLYYPSLGLSEASSDGKGVPYVRCLRHARIGAPTILLPEGHAKRKNEAMGFESTGKMIVRSLRPIQGKKPEGRDSTRDTPKVSQRLIVVPNVPQSVAARHHAEEKYEGVFDRNHSSTRPEGAYQSIEYAKYGCFPTALTTTKVGIGRAPHIDEREIVSNPSSVIDNTGDEASGPVYVPLRFGTEKDTGYYPDPAAEYLIIRVRRPGTETTKRSVLPGSPLAVRLRNGKEFPFRETVLLSIRREHQRRGLPTQETILNFKGSRNIDADSPDNIVTSFFGHSVQEVELQLDPGDQFDVEMWIAPSGWRLAHDFAQVQSMVQYLCNRGRSYGDPEGICTEVMLKLGIKNDNKMSAEKKEILLKYLSKDKAKGSDTRYVGPGGEVLPEIRLVRALGRALHHLLLQHPLPEIAAVRRLAAIHAVNVPSEKHRPIVNYLQPVINPFPSPLCPIEPSVKSPEPFRAIRPSELGVDVPGFSDSVAIASGSKLMALKGEVKIDPERVDVLEFVARTISPYSTIFDDPARGRSLARRIAGTWPTNDAENGEEQEFRQAKGIFGFRVAKDGRTELEQSEITLLRIDNLPFAKQGDTSHLVDIGPYFLGVGEEKNAVSRRHAFPDGKARRLEVRVNALARTAELMKTAARVARRGDPWLDRRYSGLVYEKGDLIPAEGLPREMMVNLSKPVEVIMPSTVRPSTVEAFAPVPTFEDQEEKETSDGIEILRASRRNVVRIPLGRGWFSSGVDERLGIVIWPPHQALSDHEKISRNVVPLRSATLGCSSQLSLNLPGGICPGGLLGEAPPAGEIAREVEISDFEDGDLGPGGGFVTRRGGDPVRMASLPAPEESEKQVFLSKESFPDLWRHPADPHLAEYVPQTWMPLSDAPDEAELDEPDGDPKKIDPTDFDPPMAVGLIAYRPLFDPEREEWYVDVILHPGVRADSFVRLGLVRYQPHTRADLRCSRPTIQWVQPLPDRDLLISETETKDALNVVVSGMVTKGRADIGLLDPDLTDQLKNRNASLMRLTLFREGKSAAGVDTRVTVDISERIEGKYLPNHNESLSIDLIPDVNRGQATWSGKIDLTDLSGLRNLRLSVEEIEYFPSATLGTTEEPLDIGALPDFKESEDLFWQESGPRFSQVLDLSSFTRTKAQLEN